MMKRMNTEDVLRSWEKLLTPEILRANLLMTSLYLAAFEILKTTIIERIRGFFTIDFYNGQRRFDVKYQEVIALHRSLLQASCFWLQQNGAITADDVEMFDAIRQHRNELAHELPQFLSEVDRNISTQSFENIRYLLRKIETWWIREVHIPTNSEFDNLEVADEDIQAGSVIILDAIIELALEAK